MKPFKKFQNIVLNSPVLNKWAVLFVLLGILITTVYISKTIVDQLRSEEEHKVETIVAALELQSSDRETSPKARDLALRILAENNAIPLILIDEDNVFSYQKNLDHIEKRLETDSLFLKNYIEKLRSYHEPIKVDLPFGTQNIYYQSSTLLKKLQYYPLILIIVLIIFAALVIWYFRIVDASLQNFLWAGMAKETAHQIGTPLSSLLGWVEILKYESVDKDILHEIESDVRRLNQIADRFSKIGSAPELQKTNVTKVAKDSYEYLKKRISDKVSFSFYSQEEALYSNASPELLSWVFENIMRNAVDAMQNRGEISFKILKKEKKIIILIKDTGPGIDSNKVGKIFDVGYTTKKRGWGIGLSLAKRIVEEFHNGSIYVDFSDKDNGTQFCVELEEWTKD
ncbi:HAMP domain-containing histidine kinase [Ornithobacterium rhinotracheale]|uniref:histidine kinase n=1 Tax=Ornithobacterium rhinotracheale TaxID=28251 RepID=A0A3R5Y4S4_ORNRH|nr:HAMP domain-containing sensor histidine kinase [Ornithobacterium rhinotracheale]QAR31710.1 HAMP domain-containing histidine kinase [Ornithobacterium rhinotracheale]